MYNKYTYFLWNPIKQKQENPLQPGLVKKHQPLEAHQVPEVVVLLLSKTLRKVSRRSCWSVKRHTTIRMSPRMSRARPKDLTLSTRFNRCFRIKRQSLALLFHFWTTLWPWSKRTSSDLFQTSRDQTFSSLRPESKLKTKLSHRGHIFRASMSSSSN